VRLMPFSLDARTGAEVVTMQAEKDASLAGVSIMALSLLPATVR